MSGVGNFTHWLNPDLTSTRPYHPRSELKFEPPLELGTLFNRQVNDFWMSTQHVDYP